jgi:PAS domain S-box-containing protein
MNPCAFDEGRDGRNTMTAPDLKRAAPVDLAEEARAARAEAAAARAERDAQARAFQEARAELHREAAERERVNLELARQRSILQHVIDTVPYSVFWKDRNSVYLGANQKKLRALGMASVDQLVGKTDYDTGVRKEDAEFYRKRDREVMDRGESILNMEELQIRSDGPHVLLTSKVPFRDEGGTVVGILGIYIDITERKRMEQELAEAKEVAEAAARKQSEFLTVISHEIRTPLTLILGPLEAMLSGASGDLPDRARGDLERVRRNARRLFLLMNDILDFAKLEAGKLEVHREGMDLAALVTEIWDDARPLARQKSIDLCLRVEPGPLSASIDRAKFEKITLNLVGNALKFTPAGGRIELRLHESGEDFVLSVRDTGPGIPADKRDLLFRRFAQIDSSLTRRHEGTGLGLAIVKELTELMGGQVGFESEVGKGSLFFVKLPKRRDLSDGPSAEHNEPARPSAAGHFERWAELFQSSAGNADSKQRGQHPSVSRRRTVLIVEDNADMRGYMRDILGDFYAVEEADNGKSALALLEHQHPAVIVADIMMPEMDGLELVARLKADAERKRIPVVLVTAKASREEIVAGLDAGADDYLSKPFGPAELRARVQAAERQRLLSDELEAKNRELELTLQKLREMQDELIQAGKMAAVGTLVAGISHELNNPIASILMNAESLLKRLPEDSAWKRHIDAIGRQAERSGRLVKLLLDFSRRKPIATGPLAVGEFLGRVIELAGSQVKGGNVALALDDVETDLPAIEASVQEMEVAILNLVKNAIDATSAAGGHVSIAARKRARDGVVGVEIAVTDDGPGIPPEVLPRIFEPFFTTKPVGMGCGLGLALAKRIVESQGGQLRAESRPGLGTSMRAWLAPSRQPTDVVASH